MKTHVRLLKRVKLRDPVLIEGLPGLALVGRLSVGYLVEALKAEKLAELYSPHFPYYVIVDGDGRIRLPKGEFYYWRGGGRAPDLLLMVGDSQAQTAEGQYEVATCVLEFARKHGVKTVITVGGYRTEGGGNRVMCASTSKDLLDMAVNAGATVSPPGSPIVGIAGLLLGLAGFSDMEALCLLGETRGHIPDPGAAKNVLKVLTSMLGLEVDLSGLDKSIKEAAEIERALSHIELTEVLGERRPERGPEYIF
ncbi:MAG TPA: proteasome assembly chaperone family protein [Candidatus Bathyarchaeota archaeon]|nr:proteasome assembly chaperone family protein [Candidatus Bathyarchaeota archaeon]HEW89797.1 proteasome assembly chaperone family protein [Candidatus Bathyarchaeota archaeon]